MNSTSPFMTLEKSGEEAIPWIIQLLENAGLEVMCTFNLQEARLSHPDCPCPHHGTETCTCQVSVLLAYYPSGQPPASLMVHSFEGTTWLYLMDIPERLAEHKLEALIRKTLIQAVPGILENSDGATEQRLQDEIH